MITTTAPLIDIAVEAGYGSHEAFTRAFTKAYGVGPAAWRRKPGHIQVEAPSGVHFHPPGGLRLPARDKVSPMDLMTKMVEHHVWLTGEMVRVAERLTDEQLDQPIVLDVDEDRQTIRSLLSRLVGQMGMWNAAMASRDYDWSVEEHESLSSLRERFAVEGATYLGHVRDVVDAGRLDDTFVDALCEPAEVFTYGGMIAHVLTFAAHRRTLVALAFGPARHRGARLGRSDALGGRTHRLTAEPCVVAPRTVRCCAGTDTSARKNAHLGPQERTLRRTENARLGGGGRGLGGSRGKTGEVGEGAPGRMGSWRSRSSSSCSPSPCSASPPSPAGSTYPLRCC